MMKFSAVVELRVLSSVTSVCVCVQGILSDDCVLAAALWRNLFNRECEDPRQLELMVEYVRKQVCLSRI